MKIKNIFPLVVTFASLALIAWAMDAVSFRSPHWTGFYYRNVGMRTEPVSFILKTPDMRSPVGAFQTLEACTTWAKNIRMKQQLDKTYAIPPDNEQYMQDDLFYCSRQCLIHSGSGGDCKDPEAQVFLFGK
mgnify:CR=1 FL=1